jgi:Mn2+/Fe2+ NRAMP family transporter
MIIMMLLANNKTLMGKATLTRRHSVLGWLGVALMFAAVCGMAATF